MKYFQVNLSRIKVLCIPAKDTKNSLIKMNGTCVFLLKMPSINPRYKIFAWTTHLLHGLNIPNMSIWNMTNWNQIK